MKTKSNILTIFVLLLLPVICVSENIPKEKAAKLAVNFFKSGIENKNLNLSLDISDTHTIYTNEIPVFYAFNFEDGGFVVTPTDDLFYPVLAFSFEGSFSEKEFPPNLKSWMNWYNDQIVVGINDPNKCFKDRTGLWNELLKPDSDFFSDDIGVEPLLISKWNQTNFYNEMCPADPEGYAGHTPVGCVATAMSQLMYYYRFPPIGNGSYSYTPPYGDSIYGEQFADFGNTYYQWDEMQDKCIESNPAVAELCYHCGVSVDMAYQPNTAGANTIDVPSALINYFNYAPSAYYQDRNELDSTAQWIAMLTDNLNNHQPVLYRSTNGWVGHTYICDGYQDSTFYHFNWGWAGTYNGYYYIDELIPGGINLSFCQGAVFNIYPDTTQFEYPNFCSGIKILTSKFGTIEDGSGPENYEAFTQCQWLILPEDTSITNILLEFSILDTELGIDTILVYDGESAEAEILGVFSGNEIPDKIHSSSNALFVTFHSNEDVQYNGWKLSFYGYDLPFCEGVVEVNEKDGFIEDGSKHLEYSNNADCSWLIAPQVPITDSVDRINLHFDFFGIAYDDTLYIYDGENDTMPLLGKCSGWTQPEDIISSSNLVFLNFKTNSVNTGAGWKISYSSLNPEYCKDTVLLTEQSGLIEDGSGTKNYLDNTECYWVIEIPNADFIVLDFMEVDLENNYDHVKIFDLNNPSQFIERITGHDPYPPITVNSNRVLLKFYTDFRDNYGGWKMAYHSSGEGIDEENSSSILVYPNPFTDQINISIENTNLYNSTFKLLDISGRVISKGKLIKTYEQINMKNLKAGIFLLKICNDKNCFYKKIVKH